MPYGKIKLCQKWVNIHLKEDANCVCSVPQIAILLALLTFCVQMLSESNSFNLVNFNKNNFTFATYLDSACEMLSNEYK